MVTAHAKLKKEVNKERLDVDGEMRNQTLHDSHLIHIYVMFDLHKRRIDVLHSLVVCTFVLQIN